MTRKQDEFSKKQDEFSRLQKETHKEVMNIKDNICDVKGIVGDMQSSLSLNEKMSTHNTRGVRLVSRAVSSLIPHEIELLKEMKQYENSFKKLQTRATSMSSKANKNRM